MQIADADSDDDDDGVVQYEAPDKTSRWLRGIWEVLTAEVFERFLLKRYIFERQRPWEATLRSGEKARRSRSWEDLTWNLHESPKKCAFKCIIRQCWVFLNTSYQFWLRCYHCSVKIMQVKAAGRRIKHETNSRALKELSCYLVSQVVIHNCKCITKPCYVR